MIGTCAICGEEKKLTFEHIPPEKAFNNYPIYIKKHKHLFDKSSYVYGKSIRSNRGSGGYYLCENCNNNTGSWYGDDFGNFVHQGMEIINQPQNSGYVVKGTYNIRPLSVLKQILSMFMSLDSIGHLRSFGELTDFILDKDKTGISGKFKIYLFSNLSNRKRMMGNTWVPHPKYGLCQWSEINFEPFGYFLTTDSKPPHKHMVDISHFSNVPYRQEVRYIITTPYLILGEDMIGLYVNNEQF